MKVITRYGEILTVIGETIESDSSLGCPEHLVPFYKCLKNEFDRNSGRRYVAMYDVVEMIDNWGNHWIKKED